MTRALLQTRLARLERRVTDAERHAWYAQRVQLPTPSTDSARAILKTIIASGQLMTTTPTVLNVTLFTMLHPEMSVADVEAFFTNRQKETTDHVA